MILEGQVRAIFDCWEWQVRVDGEPSGKGYQSSREEAEEAARKRIDDLAANPDKLWVTIEKREV